tara:strand:+ start:1598 stop:1828 length:231 start_codon:yes stop_codon:yes gene_type:complete
MQNLTDEPKMTTEAKDECLLAAYKQLELARSDIQLIMDRIGGRVRRGGPELNEPPGLFYSIRTCLTSAERLIQLGN